MAMPMSMYRRIIGAPLPQRVASYKVTAAPQSAQRRVLRGCLEACPELRRRACRLGETVCAKPGLLDWVDSLRTDAPVTADRVPRIALVLSGGGARGAYEAGVLSYLFGDLAA